MLSWDTVVLGRNRVEAGESGDNGVCACLTKAASFVIFGRSGALLGRKWSNAGRVRMPSLF